MISHVAKILYSALPPRALSRGLQVIQEALVAFREDVTSGGFPSAAFSPYKMSDDERQDFVQRLQEEGLAEAAEAVKTAVRAV